MKRLPLLAWSLFGLCAASASADMVLTALTSSLFSEEAMARHGWPFATIAVVGSAGLGALIISSYPRHRIGWLLVASGTSASLSLVAEAYSSWVLKGDGPGPQNAGHVFGWISALLGAPLAFSMLSIIFFIAPDGSVLSPRWRWGVVTSIAGIGIYTLAVLTTSPTESVPNEDQQFGLVSQVLFIIGFLLLAGGMIAAAVNLVLRLRRSTGVRRQQLRWIAVVAAGLAFGVVWLLVASAIVSDSSQSWLTAMPLFIAYVFLPIGIALAVLRYRLYDVDLIINRAVLLAFGTAFAAGGYIGLVVGVGAAVGNWTRGFWPSLVATAIVAVAFQPIRTRVVQLADRLVYGAKAIPYDALSDLTERIGASPAPEALLPTVAQAAGLAVAASEVTVRLTLPSAAERSANWPGHPTFAAARARTNTTAFAVDDDGEQLGSIEVGMPAGRDLRARDHELLGVLAGHVGLAFRQARLAEQLAERVDLLDRRADELTESRERIIATRDAERSRLESTIRREVTAHIDDLPHQLDDLSRAPVERRAAALPALSDLIDRSILALESLREITHGIFPAQLSRAGLPAAIAGQLGESGTTDALSISERFGKQRFAAAIEAAVYFCYVETIAGLDRPLHIELDVEGSRLQLRIIGTAAADPNLDTLQDRLDPWDGRAAWTRDGELVIVTIQVPTDEVAVSDRAVSTRR